MVRNQYWFDKRVIISCDEKDYKALQNCSNWVVVETNFNMQTMRGEALLRPLTTDDL